MVPRGLCSEEPKVAGGGEDEGEGGGGDASRNLKHDAEVAGNERDWEDEGQMSGRFAGT